MEREDARRRTLYLAVVTAVVFYLAYLAREAVVPLLVALLMAYVLAPLVAILERRGFSRVGAVSTLFVLFFGSLLLTGILAIWLWVHLTTKRLLKRLHYLEEFMHVCSWCRKVGHEGQWLTTEEYFGSKFATQTSHGICEECARKTRIPPIPEVTRS